MGKIPISAPSPSPQSGPPTAGALNRSHGLSSAGEGFRGTPGRRLLPSRSSASPLGFLSPTSGLPGVPLPRGSWLPLWIVGWEEKAPKEQLKVPPSRDSCKGGKEEFWPLPITSGPPAPSQLSSEDRRLPRQDPRPMLAYLGVHTKLTGPQRRSHIVGPLLAPAPSPGPRRGAARRRPHSSGWQLQFKRLIKASQGGGGGHAGPVPRPRPGARGATGCAGR